MKLILLCLLPAALLAQSPKPDALSQLLTRAEATHTEAVLVYRAGTVVAEKYMGKGRANRKTEAMSATKSIVSLAIGKLITDGKIKDVDVPVWTFYPEWKQGRKQQVTLRMLLNHTSGMQNVPNTSVEIYPSPNFVQQALAAELSDAPGTVFSYNNKAVNLLAGVIERASGERMDRYIGRALFAPLGIQQFTWSLDGAGNPHAMAGCQIRPADFLKLGILTLNRGQWNGQRLIDERWFDQCMTPAALSPTCGLLWWLVPERDISDVTADNIAKLKAGGVPDSIVTKAGQLIGRYETPQAYQQAVERVFGPNPWPMLAQQITGRGLKLRDRLPSPIVAYRADGYLGNYIVVVPQRNVVAVRMISHDSYQTDADSFADFDRYVLAYAQQP